MEDLAVIRCVVVTNDRRVARRPREANTPFLDISNHTTKIVPRLFANRESSHAQRVLEGNLASAILAA
jgi:hypothetical protein